ncbi:MAG: nucleotidyltransferase domain-containing protein [Spirochaetota bacterium]|jgi:predicted nucleotidyltransferase
MFSHDRKALLLLSSLLRERMGDDIESIFAFGSRVRGDNDDRSDFDVLIVVKDRNPAKEAAIIDTIVDFEMERGLSLTPLLKDAASFTLEREHNAPFYQNITREGVRL